MLLQTVKGLHIPDERELQKAAGALLAGCTCPLFRTGGLHCFHCVLQQQESCVEGQEVSTIDTASRGDVTLMNTHKSHVRQEPR